MIRPVIRFGSLYSPATVRCSLLPSMLVTLNVLPGLEVVRLRELLLDQGLARGSGRAAACPSRRSASRTGRRSRTWPGRRRSPCRCRRFRSWRRRTGCPVAVATPGTLAAACTTGAGMVWKLCPWMIMSLVIERSIAPRNDSLKPFTNTATNTISATPIMSAAEVTAVRLGFREVFSRASTPAVGDDASHGHSRRRRFQRSEEDGRRRSPAPRRRRSRAGRDAAAEDREQDQHRDDAGPDVAQGEPVAHPADRAVRARGCGRGRGPGTARPEAPPRGRRRAPRRSARSGAARACSCRGTR